jgi:hypothetical protein
VTWPWSGFKSFRPLKEQIELECEGAPVGFVDSFVDVVVPGGPFTSPPSATLTPTPTPAKTAAQSAAAIFVLYTRSSSPLVDGPDGLPKLQQLQGRRQHRQGSDVLVRCSPGAPPELAALLLVVGHNEQKCSRESRAPLGGRTAGEQTPGSLLLSADERPFLTLMWPEVPLFAFFLAVICVLSRKSGVSGLTIYGFQICDRRPLGEGGRMGFLISAQDVEGKRKPHPTLEREAGPLHRPRFPTARERRRKREVVPSDRVY